jgi:hypothetical protein
MFADEGPGAGRKEWWGEVQGLVQSVHSNMRSSRRPPRRTGPRRTARPGLLVGAGVRVGQMHARALGGVHAWRGARTCMRTRVQEGGTRGRQKGLLEGGGARRVKLGEVPAACAPRLFGKFGRTARPFKFCANTSSNSPKSLVQNASCESGLGGAFGRPFEMPRIRYPRVGTLVLQP